MFSRTCYQNGNCLRGKVVIETIEIMEIMEIIEIVEIMESMEIVEILEIMKIIESSPGESAVAFCLEVCRCRQSNSPPKLPKPLKLSSTAFTNAQTLQSLKSKAQKVNGCIPPIPYWTHPFAQLFVFQEYSGRLGPFKIW